ncbi:hypothetical protein BD31_I1450 [Candidatus Nitrosopumilus salaria BD31]|uniref:Uncharacterized protein n=1 Tax=Candidatus Nitrosopumilus salarius BD31 TaxID=859350 RepID=I3D5K1_9ARCH|nr:InlB B-repeat-containing protein [Candidatus Nitrosopumilus salaria]EIJ66994.1 hypothetical protein BD31_I1450 [Candidatus Nitrosopumilus salaria BD31]
MLKILFAITAMVLVGVSANYAYSQEMGLATFQEMAQVIVDKSISQNVTASITLQSTSIQEIKIPAELEQRIRENGSISAVTITNQNQCILGVDNQSCILINVKRNPVDKNFLQIQNRTLQVSEQFISEINDVFDTDAKLHSTFIHSSDETSVALETSGVISGKGTISAVYTMPMEKTSSMYEKISAILIPKAIRDSGGFYDVAKNLSKQDNAKMTFSIIPSDNNSLLQLRVSANYPQTASKINEISPLEFLKTNELKRSDYFSTGFYPLNSIIQVVVLSPEDTNVSDVNGNIIPTQIIEGDKIPTDITKKGWIFDPEEGQRIQGKYIFGKETTVSKNELKFSLGGTNIQSEKPVVDESIIVVIIITIVAIAAAIFYLKGYKK